MSILIFYFLFKMKIFVIFNIIRNIIIYNFFNFILAKILRLTLKYNINNN